MSVPTELFDYVERPDEAYRYTILSDEELGRGRMVDLELTSQIWQGIVWKHRLLVFIPDEPSAPDMALLTIGADFSNPEDYYRDLGALYIEGTGVVCAFLFDVPNQPLFDGMIEDTIIAHTLVQYLDTGEAGWPLLFPMTKSVVRAMDAIQALLQEKGRFAPERFVTTGMSKRGWTTWLSAVVDKRVAGIVPMVYDNLNLIAQLPHQREVWADYSEQISDYTEHNLPERMRTPQGFHLAQMIDPYTYRERLSLPKLIMNGANDRYWATDALNLYWDGLDGPKHVLYVPNGSHGLNDPQRVWSAAQAFVAAVAKGSSLPPLQWEFQEEPNVLHLTLKSDAPITGARLWVNVSETLDFRPGVWEAQEVALTPEGGKVTLPLPDKDCLAAFAEIDLAPTDLPAYSLSTQVHIVDHRGGV